jgi:hypothetical protein
LEAKRESKERKGKSRERERERDSDDSTVEVMMRRNRTKIVEMSNRSEQPGKNRKKQIRVNKIQKI